MNNVGRMLIESHEVGYVAKKLRQEGEVVPVDMPIAVFCEEVCELVSVTVWEPWLARTRASSARCQHAREGWLRAFACPLTCPMAHLPPPPSPPRPLPGRTRGRVP